MALKLLSGGNNSVLAGYPMDEGSLRHRRTTLNLSALSQLKALPGSLKTTTDIRVGLFNDTSYVCTVQWQSTPNSFKAFHGHVKGKPNSRVVITTRGKRLSLRLWVDNAEYIVAPVERDSYLVEQVNPQLPILCDTDSKSRLRKLRTKAGQRKFVWLPGPTIVTVLMLFDKGTEDRAGGSGSLRVQIDSIVEDLNQALRASLQGTGKEVLIRLVNVRRFDKDLSQNNCTAKSQLRKDEDIKKWRMEDGADLVSMLRNVTATSCAHCLDSPAGDREAFVSAVNYSQAMSRHSFAHEIGHNFGCPHNPENADCKGINNAFRDKKKRIYWGHKWQTKKKWYGTLMAYTGGTRIPYFSNPKVNYEGKPIGKADRNNAAAIAMTADSIASYRGLAIMSPRKRRKVKQ